MTTLTLQPGDCRIRARALAVLAWVLGVVVLGASGALASSDGLLRLLMPAIIVLPPLGFLLAYRFSESLRAFVLALDTGLLVTLHSWRMLGAGFLFLHAHGVLPGLFAWPAGLGDMLTALGALLIGTVLLRGGVVSRRVLLAWNSFGLLDFVIAVALGTALRSTYLGGAIPTDAMAVLPLSLVPTLVVPFYLITHVIIYLQLRHRPYLPVDELAPTGGVANSHERA